MAKKSEGVLKTSVGGSEQREQRLQAEEEVGLRGDRREWGRGRTCTNNKTLAPSHRIKGPDAKHTLQATPPSSACKNLLTCSLRVSRVYTLSKKVGFARGRSPKG